MITWHTPQFWSKILLLSHIVNNAEQRNVVTTCHWWMLSTHFISASATSSGVSPWTWWRHQMEIFPRYWQFVRGIHRSPANSPHKGQWRGPLMFSLICVWINGCVNNREAGDLRRYPTHCDVTVMNQEEPSVELAEVVSIQIEQILSYDHDPHIYTHSAWWQMAINKPR